MKFLENILSLTPLEHILSITRGETWKTIRTNFLERTRPNPNPYDYYYLPNPHPIIPEIPKELPPPKMLPDGFVDIINKNEDNSPRQFPSSTSSINDYMTRWCGTTENNVMYSGSTTFYGYEEENDSSLDETPLRRLLMKKFKWIEDVTEVNKHPRRPLEIHITVSPIHHTELMIPSVEKIVREKLYEELNPLVTCMYEQAGRDKPVVIFSPSHSETILEHFK